MTQSISSFFVVEFPCEGSDEAEVEVVPYLWLFNNSSKCYWPNVKSSERISNLVATRAVPNEKWQIFDVSRVFGHSETYLDARRKAIKAVDDSDINTDSQTRKRRPPKKLVADKVSTAAAKTKKVQKIASDISGDESSEMESLPRTPPRFRFRTDNNSSAQVPPSMIVTKKNLSAMTVPSTSQGSSMGTGNFMGFTATTVPSTSQGSSMGIGNLMGFTATTVPSTSQGSSMAIGNLMDFTATTVPSTPQGSSMGNGNLMGFTANSPARSEWEQRGSEFERQVKRDLFGIKTRLSQMETTLNLIVSQISSKFAEPEIQFAFRLPCNSLEELEDLNVTLEAELSQQQLIKFFRTLGGSCTADMTRRILRKVMTDQVASNVNWKGQNGKHSFETTRVASLIISAVQAFYGDGSQQANSKVVEITAKEWLKQASNRLKQKSGRASAS